VICSLLWQDLRYFSNLCSIEHLHDNSETQSHRNGRQLQVKRRSSIQEKLLFGSSVNVFVRPNRVSRCSSALRETAWRR
jgi:hypothetical protein